MTRGPVQDLVDRLTEWASAQPWVDWLELGGSLGRGSGDEFSDIDAGIGVAENEDIPARRQQCLDAIGELAPVAASLVQDLGESSWHLIVAYEDARQLSLVVMPASDRSGLPPQAMSLVNRTGRLSVPLSVETWTPDDALLHEWTFLAWIAVGDAARHTHRGHPWRALRSLTEARDLVWQLWAASLGLTFPAFGAVTVENANARSPRGIERTHPSSLEQDDLYSAADALGRQLRSRPDPALDALADVVEGRLRALRSNSQ